MNIILLCLLTLPLLVTATSLDPEMAMRKKMMDWSRQLGVTCVDCHDLKNFRSNLKPAFKTASLHSKIVQLVDDPALTNSKFSVDCFMCHRGKLIPEYKEPATLYHKTE